METPGNSPRSQSRFSSPARVLLLAAGVIALLGLVAAASRAHHTPGGHAGSHSAPAGAADYLFTVFALVMVGGALLMLYAWFAERGQLAAARTGRSSSVRPILILLVFALLGAVWLRFGHVHLRGADSGQGGVPVGVAGPATKTKAGERAPELKLLPVLLAGGVTLLALGVVGARSLRRSREELVDEWLLEREFEELLEDTLADLRAETDPRKAIIAAYARVERLFASFGLPRHFAEAPVEYLERVLPELRASGHALRRLTALFEWAKFSTHDVDAPMRDEAIDALVSVRDDLRLSRVEPDVLT
jgi:hypothetical protein